MRAAAMKRVRRRRAAADMVVTDFVASIVGIACDDSMAYERARSPDLRLGIGAQRGPTDTPRFDASYGRLLSSSQDPSPARNATAFDFRSLLTSLQRP